VNRICLPGEPGPWCHFPSILAADRRGLIATDGPGAFAGGGLALGMPELGVTFALVGRAIETVEERRFELGFDLTIPFTSDGY
jgi:hypothetical protein